MSRPSDGCVFARWVLNVSHTYTSPPQQRSVDGVSGDVRYVCVCDQGRKHAKSKTPKAGLLAASLGNS